MVTAEVLPNRKGCTGYNTVPQKIRWYLNLFIYFFFEKGVNWSSWMKRSAVGYKKGHNWKSRCD